MASKRKWEVVSKRISAETSFQVDEIIDQLLKNRGIQSKKDRDEFLNPNLESVTTNSVGIDKKQLTLALGRITKAVEKNEQIIVFGDYDVDGITGCAILWETLHEVTPHVMPYIPHRTEEGYGLSVKGIDNVLAQYPETKLIITVDNGIVANDAVDYANSKGLDVIITDHHMPQGEEAHTHPDAYAIVHTTLLCGAGVAYLLSKYIREKLKKSEGYIVEDQHLELAALGTIADMVPLTGANRTIAYHGLRKLKQTKRLGLKALLKEAQIDTNVGISSYHVGHMIAPRLNASGRLESAMDSLRLLCTNRPTRAEELAFTLSHINKQRQDVMRDQSLHAIEYVRKNGVDTKKILIISHESYQEGVIGLIAGKLVEEFYRPAIVIAERETHSKASVRSIKGFNIIEFLRSHNDYFVNVGGHPMAAGFTIETEKIVDFVSALENSAASVVTDDMLSRTVIVDMELDFSQITDNLYQKITELEPFGVGNYEPVFLTKQVVVDDMRVIGREGKHLKMKVSKDTRQFDVIAFGMGERSSEIESGDLIDIVYSIDENVWNGRRSLQLKLKDLKKSTK